MTEGLKWTVNHVARSDDKHLELMSEENVKKANEFHKSFPQYTVTPLQDLAELASYLGVKSIHCKDESYRFGLNAFKVLGGSYAMGRYIAKEVGKDISELPYAVLHSNRWKPRTRSCMGCQTSRTESSCPYAKRNNENTF